MKRTAAVIATIPLTLALLLACSEEAGELPSEPGVPALHHGVDDEPTQYTDWSEPVNLGPPVNTSDIDQGLSIDREGLSLFFQSTRPGGFGGADIWVAQRDCVSCPWKEPVNLGPVVNTEFSEMAPRLTIDGHRLFFNSNRPGGFGGSDLYEARRHDKRNDFEWFAPVNLGAGVNTAGDDATAQPFGDDFLYYATGPAGTGAVDIYLSTRLPDGTYGPGVPVAELNTASVERQPAIRRDGLELIFASDRSGPVGNLDLWVATRASTSDAWSTPVSLGPTINSSVVDARPALSFDGTVLYFQSTRPGGLGSFDFYVSTRSKLKQQD